MISCWQHDHRKVFGERWLNALPPLLELATISGVKSTRDSLTLFLDFYSVLYTRLQIYIWRLPRNSPECGGLGASGYILTPVLVFACFYTIGFPQAIQDETFQRAFEVGIDTLGCSALIHCDWSICFIFFNMVNFIILYWWMCG